ncbi:hypothetical protein L227DRAFT_513167, partial [Lentinus tigrinus ALCF2SS1-6]
NSGSSSICLALLCSEYLAHFTQEVVLFWTSEITGASVLFLSNRYLPLLSTITQMVALVPMSRQVCRWLSFSSLRTYALCSRHRLAVATIVFLLSSVPIGINFSRYRWLSSTTVPVLHFTIASRVSLIAADLVVLVVTWRATYYGTGLRAIQPHCRPSFSHILLRDGEHSLSQVLLTLNILHLLFTLLSISSESLVPVSYITIFTEPITAILISRFIINLQEVNRGIDHSQAESSALATASQSTIDFAKVVGPLGSSLGLSDDRTETDVGGVENERAPGMVIETVSRM